MLWAQWVLLILMTGKLVVILAMQGKTTKGNTFNGWDVMLLMCGFVLSLLAGAFSGIFGYP